MLYLEIDRTSSVPLYQQIYQQIKYKILTKEAKHLELLPSEVQFSKIYNISSFVVKRSYAMLEDENLIKRIKGKGTYVNSRFTYVGIMEHPITLVLPTGKGLNPTLLYQEIINTNDEIKNVFQNEVRGPYDFIRVIMTKDGLPIAYMVIYMAKEIHFDYEYWMRYIENPEFLGYNRFYEDFDVKTNINASKTSKLLSEILEIEKEDFVIVVKSIIKKNGRKVGYVKSIYPAPYTELKAVDL